MYLNVKNWQFSKVWTYLAKYWQAGKNEEKERCMNDWEVTYKFFEWVSIIFLTSGLNR